MNQIRPDEVRMVLDHLPASTAEVTDARCLPRECYVSDSFFEFERAAVFERSWLGLGRVEQIPEPGDYFTLTVCDEPLLVVRDKAGEVRVLSNVCPHRHHLIAEGDGHTDRNFRCPLHAWSFDHTGELVHATGMNHTDFDRSQFCLPSLSVEIWNGFIFAHHQPDPPPLAPTLAKVDAEAEPYGLADLVTSPPIDSGPFPWNWKTMFENGIEPFHTHFLHKGQHDFAPFAEFVPWDDDDGAVLHPTRFKQMDQSFNPLWKGLLEPLPGLDERRRTQVMFIAAMPTLYFGLMPDHVFWMLILPEGPGRVRLRNGILHHPSARELPNFEARMQWIIDGLLMLFDEDATANTSVQVGRRSRYARPGPYAAEEVTLPQVNRWLARRYEAGYRAMATDPARSSTTEPPGTAVAAPGNGSAAASPTAGSPTAPRSHEELAS
ncbi:MAG: aromatic ring-hydroxylating dioxygenase subunit alpha [Actinomycetota bacterium]|nr:aromatic ring-hydroxylating dioxygenase subunit alpha [Actinomycetota bacterium]